MLAEILVSLDEPMPEDVVPRAIGARRVTPELDGAVVRLPECLRNPADSRILGSSIAREIVYRVLQDESGAKGASRLRALAARCDPPRAASKRTSRASPSPALPL